MHFYAFGSICRGDIDEYSDVDLLAIVEDINNHNLDSIRFSIYSYQRIQELWVEGNPFAWHLATESKILYSSNDEDFVKNLGAPSNYNKVKYDCLRFYTLFITAKKALDEGSVSYVFELGNIYLAIRNYATCFGLGYHNKMEFSRYSAFRLGEDSIEIDETIFSILQRARFLCTRGIGKSISKNELEKVTMEQHKVENWMKKLNDKLTYGPVY